MISLNSTFTKNQDSVININGKNIYIQGCNVINNSEGIFINSSAKNITPNYNRIFNNTGIKPIII